MVDPSLHGGPQPLAGGIGNQFLRHSVAVQHQAVEHQGQVRICDGPFTEQVIDAIGQQDKCRCKKLFAQRLVLQRDAWKHLVPYRRRSGSFTMNSIELNDTGVPV